LPLYKNGILVGGIGVTGDGTDNSFPLFLDRTPMKMSRFRASKRVQAVVEHHCG